MLLVSNKCITLKAELNIEDYILLAELTHTSHTSLYGLQSEYITASEDIQALESCLYYTNDSAPASGFKSHHG